MVQFAKQVQENGTWRLLDKDGNPIGRIWLTAHVDRIIRDGALAETIYGIVTGPGGAAAKRTAARDAYSSWLTAGGHAADFSAITISENNDAGVADDNLHIYIAGNELGYLHGMNNPLAQRIARYVQLAEEVWASDQQNLTAAQKNAAIDAAMDRFRTAGGLNGGG